VGDLRREHDVAGRPTDRRGAQEPVDDVLQLRGVACDDAHEQVARPAGGVGLQHLGDGLEVGDRLGQAALGDLQEDERRDRIAHPRGLDVRPEAADDATLGQLRQARLHGSPGDTEAAGDLHQPDARLGGQHIDQAGVEVVELTGHSAQRIPRFTARS
jgi:hypothetical protein